MSADHPQIKRVIDEAINNKWNYTQLAQELATITNQSINLIGQLTQRELQTLKRSWPFVSIDTWLQLYWLSI